MKYSFLTKSVLRLLPLGLFFTVMGLASCNSESGCVPEEIHAGVPEEIVSFFDSNGRAFIDYFYSCYNMTSWPSFPEDTCCLVNSRVELQNMYTGNEELPEIDFDKNSLIIGLVMENDAHVVNIKTIDIINDSIIVYVKSEKMDLDRDKYALRQAYFPYLIWELYEKLPQKKTVLKR